MKEKNNEKIKLFLHFFIAPGAGTWRWSGYEFWGKPCSSYLYLLTRVQRNWTIGGRSEELQRGQQHTDKVRLAFYLDSWSWLGWLVDYHRYLGTVPTNLFSEHG